MYVALYISVCMCMRMSASSYKKCIILCYLCTQTRAQVKAVAVVRREHKEYLVTADGRGVALVWDCDTFDCCKVAASVCACMCV